MPRSALLRQEGEGGNFFLPVTGVVGFVLNRLRPLRYVNGQPKECRMQASIFGTISSAHVLYL